MPGKREAANLCNPDRDVNRNVTARGVWIQLVMAAPLIGLPSDSGILWESPAEQNLL
jgi:hypothetical protein